MPELVFDTLDAIPEGLRETASQKDGKFVVNVVPAAKLTEFRDNNINLARERDALKAFTESVKPLIGENLAEFQARQAALVALEQQVKDGSLKGTDAVQAEVNNRTANMRADLERQNAELAKKAKDAADLAAANDQKWRQSIIDRRITEAVISEQSGALPGALQDILERAYRVFKVGDDNTLVAKDGEAIIYGSDGATPISPLEWLGTLKQKAPYFFKNSGGGGATGGGNQNGKYGGLSEQDYSKLKPEQKIALGLKLKAAGR